jgi:hypothetical protein
MSIKTQHLHKYTSRSLPLAKMTTGGEKCPVCGFRFIMRIETGVSYIYAHPNELLCQERHEERS